jgi:hypothetical protein
MPHPLCCSCVGSLVLHDFRNRLSLLLIFHCLKLLDNGCRAPKSTETTPNAGGVPPPQRRNVHAQDFKAPRGQKLSTESDVFCLTLRGGRFLSLQQTSAMIAQGRRPASRRCASDGPKLRHCWPLARACAQFRPQPDSRCSAQANGDWKRAWRRRRHKRPLLLPFNCR